MRFKIISALAMVAALAIGVTASNASFRSEVGAKIKVAKAGAPAKITFTLDNTDTENVPRRVSQVIVTSKIGKFNNKAVPQCKVAIPSNALGNNTGDQLSCPKASKIGSGTFTVNTGVAGQPIPFNDLGVIKGTMKIYNYKPSGSQQAALLFEYYATEPVPAYNYTLTPVTKGGVSTSPIPDVVDLPPNVANLLVVTPPPNITYRTLSVAHAVFTLDSPKPKKGKKPFLTLSSTKNMDISIVMERP